MKILFSSDIHGLMPAYSQFSKLLKNSDFDLGILSGDLMTHFSLVESEELISRLGIEPDDLLEELSAADNTGKDEESKIDIIYRQALKLKVRDIQDILAESDKPIYFIMGNDDGIVAGGLEWENYKNQVNINQKRIQYKEYGFVGYQYTSPFVGGLFEKPELDQRQDFLELEKLIDSKTILVTHGPPYGILDHVPGNAGYGSKNLRDLINRKTPGYHLFGHIHQCFGSDGKYINGAFPKEMKFVSIDTDRDEIKYIDYKK